MVHRYRFLMVIARALLRGSFPLTAERVLFFRAMPIFDVDVSRMFTHAYGRLTELGRWHLMFGSPFRSMAVGKKWTPVTTSEVISYQRSARNLQKIELRTKLVYWDDKRFYIAQVMSSNGVVLARSLVDGVIRTPSGILHPAEAFRLVGIEKEPAPPSDEILAQVRALQSFNQATGR